MSVNIVSTVNPANNSSSSAQANKSGKTGKHETATAPSYVPEKKTETIETPKDTVEISEAALDSEKVKGNNHWKDFDMDAFQSEIRNKLMESINQSKKALMDAGVDFVKYNEDSILYGGISEGTKAADVPEYWNAENTSQRIVDFAMSFRSMAPELSDEEYIEQIRKAVQLGYKLAKKDVGSLPGPSAKLFNDTYSLTMKKFDDLVEQARKKSAEN